MRVFTALISLFTFVMLSASITTESAAGGNDLTPRVENQLNQTDQWVIRLASDFSIIQSNLEEMIVHYKVSDRTKDRLKLLEATLRADVMKVVTAARVGDRDTVRRYLPAIARQVQQQILVLTVNDDVTREWAAARTKAQETITRIAQIGPEAFRIALALIEEGGNRVQRT
ncbi:MAG: hypothetical protein IIB67_06360 [Proteobacteria bacterium]|nr:hypothetical protein [Pseudomonadota bacterium]